MSEVASNTLVAAATKSANYSESVRIINSVIDEERNSVERSAAILSSGKYLCDENLIKEVKDTLKNYIGENYIKDTLIRIKDIKAKGYSVRVNIQGDQEVKVSEFLDGSFCKDKRISRFTLMIDNGQNGLSCEVNDKGVRCYKVQNGPPVVMMINWYVDEKMCSIEIELGVDSLKIINLNGVTEEELSMNHKIRIKGKSLVEAVQRKGSLQSTTESRVIKHKSSVMSDSQSPAPNGSKSKGKYLHDEKLIEEVKTTLSNFIDKNCIKDIKIRVRDNEAKGYSIRAKIQGNQEIKVSEFLDGSFCKDKRISRFALMIDNRQNGLSCDVNDKGARCYKVQNGPPIVLMINWYVNEKMCIIEIELDTNSLRIINLNGVNEEELTANQKITINGKSLVEAVQSVQDPLHSMTLESHVHKQKSSVTSGMYFETARYYV